MLKVAFFRGEDERGQHAIPLFGPASSVFEKTAAPTLLPEVIQYIQTLTPRKGSQYVLLNAMGAGEFWGSNINGDHFPEAALIHKPNDWTGNAVLDKVKAEGWAYGFPTFYSAHPYAHHRNKDATKAFGEVELAAWHPRMKRVELVTRVDEDRCYKFGGVSVWDKLQAGDCPDVSMGCFTAGTLVTLKDGTRKPIEQIQVGDLVLTHRGRPRLVTKTHRRLYRGDLYAIKAEAHRTIRCTHQHPFYAVPEAQVKRKDDHANLRWSVAGGILPEWAHAECLDLDHYLLAPVPCEELQSPSYGPAFARLLGYYLAEGHLLRNKKGELCGIELTTHRNDAVHDEIENLCREFGTKNPPAWHARENSENSLGIYIFDENLAVLCRLHAGEYSEQKALSPDIMDWRKDWQLELLGAYANGDGCGSEDGSLGFSTSSEQLAWQVQLLLMRSEIIPSVSVLNHKATGFSSKPTTEYVVHVGKQHALRLRRACAKIQPVEILKAKNSRVFALDRATSDRFVVTPIRSIDAIYAEVEVFNLEVEEDESYVVEGLAVHNCKVPYDTCSICLDWDTYRKAQAMFVPGRDRSPGEAVLRYHKALIKKTGKGIRGVSITRNDYCEHAKKMMNRILPDGRKVFVFNDYPNFFDISFVFIGADKTAKTMMKIAGAGQMYWSLGGAELAEKLGYADGDEELLPAFAPEGTTEKTASASVDALKLAFLGKRAEDKDAEIVKDVVPSQFVGKAIPVLTRSEKDLPKDVLNALGVSPLESALSTPSGLGMVLRPREFQRVILIQMGQSQLADELEDKGKVFPKSKETLPVPMGEEFFSSVLARLLLPMMASRSALGPSIEKRVLVAGEPPKEKKGEASSLSSPLLRKIGAAYNSYRSGVMELVAHAQTLVASTATPLEEHLHKLSAAPVESIFTPLSAGYLKLAFWDEVGDENLTAVVERVSPSKNTQAQSIRTAGGY